MNYQIVPARPRHVAMILRNLRKEELAEIIGLGFTEQQVGSSILDNLRRSIIAQAAMLRPEGKTAGGELDSEIAAIWGVTGSLLDDEWGSWLLTTELVKRHPIEFIRRARDELRRIANGRTLLGHCAEFHERGQRFLQALGFEITGSFTAQSGEVYRELKYTNGS